MLILLDLDGTLINTVHPTWKPYKDGKFVLSQESIKQIPWFYGAENFINSRKSKGDSILVVSDSHPSYVNPICASIGLDCVSLTDKPNTNKLNEYLITKPALSELLHHGNCLMIGDTKLDIEFGRKLNIPTIFFLPYRITDDIKDDRDGIGDEMYSKKMGPTFTAKTFTDIENILNNFYENLYSIESSFAGYSSTKSIKFSNIKYIDGSYAYIRCLARQEEGVCDKFACADKYLMVSNPQRTQDFLQTLGKSISTYIGQKAIMNAGWDYFTYITDKSSTIPKNKMKQIFDLINTPIKKIQIFKWVENVDGSLRDRNLYKERREFLENNLQVNNISIQGKNIVIIDDQLTTGATAWHVIQKLRNLGAGNILFIAMFQMILPVHSTINCPKCGKPMLLKIRRTDGNRFYSCTPPKFKGNGCGYIMDCTIANQIENKFNEIKKKYECGFLEFAKKRENLPNFKQLVIDSESTIALIEEMDLYIIGATDETINRALEVKENAKNIIFNHPLRNKYWGDFAYDTMDDYDVNLYCLEYAIEHLNELDEYIAKLQKRNMKR